MSLYLHLGPSGSGKTHRLMKIVIDEASASVNRNVLLIVPEQVSMQATAQLVAAHPGHTIMNADVLSFMRLAYRVFDEQGRKVPLVLDDTGKSMIVKKVALDIADKLSVYAGLVRRQGFIEELKSLICEFYQYGIDDEAIGKMLEAAGESDRLRAKLSDVRAVFNGFKDFIKERFVMNEELLDLLASVVGRSEIVRGSVLAFDGFTGFTAPQYRLLESLMRAACDVHFNVTIDPGLDPSRARDSMFALSQETIDKLTELAGLTGHKVIIDCPDTPGVRFENKALAHLEKNVFRYPYSKKDAYEGIVTACCENADVETAFVITRIKRLVREERLHYKDMAVIIADMQGMSAGVAAGFEKAGIPCFLDSKKNILGTEPVEMIRAAISVALSDYSYESVFRFIKALPADMRVGMENVENFVRGRGIRGASRWKKEWTGSVYRHYQTDLDDLNNKRETVVSLLEPCVKVLASKKSTVRERLGALMTLLTECGVKEKLEQKVELMQTSTLAQERLAAREDAQLFESIEAVFEHADSLLGADVITLKEFGDILDTGFSRQELALLPPSSDSVLIGDIERSRIADVKALFVMGLGDNVIPSKSGASGILSESDRDLLYNCNITLSPTRRQSLLSNEFYLYLCLSKPSRQLYLSYHEGTDGDAKIRPAYVLASVAKVFNSFEETKVRRDSLEIAVGADGGEAFFARLVKEKKLDLSQTELAVLESVRRDSPEVFEKALEGAFYKTGGRDITPETAEKIYGEVIVGSVTSLEKYASCAYSYFISYGLRCEDEQEFTIGSIEIGNIYHKALELYGGLLKESGHTWHDEVGDDARGGMVAEASRLATGEYGELIEDSARNRYVRTRVERVLAFTVRTIEAQVRAGSFEPAYFEKSFRVADEFMNLSGKIDRIDVAKRKGRTFLRVVDYKTGNREFDLNLLYHGLQVQLALYAKVARETIVRDAGIAGAYYYKIDEPIIEASQEMTEEELFKKKMEEQKLKGPSDREPAKLISLDRGFDGGGEEDSLASSYRSSVISVKTNKDMTLDSKSKVLTQEQFDRVFGHVDSLFRRCAGGIRSGKIKRDPYRYGDRTACEYCTYSGICGFDSRMGDGYRFIEKLSDSEIMQKISEENAEE